MPYAELFNVLHLWSNCKNTINAMISSKCTFRRTTVFAKRVLNGTLDHHTANSIDLVTSPNRPLPEHKKAANIPAKQGHAAAMEGHARAKTGKSEKSKATRRPRKATRCCRARGGGCAKLWQAQHFGDAVAKSWQAQHFGDAVAEVVAGAAFCASGCVQGSHSAAV